MGKEIIEKQSFDSLIEFDELKAISGLDSEKFLGKPHFKTKVASLVSSINYIEKINPYSGYNFGILQIEEKLRNETLRNIIYELAKAIDANSDLEVKRLKVKYGATKEFAVAKKFLDKKCKEIWNIFDNRKTKLELPKKAMKILGISNQPSLDFLFEDCLNYFEKENSTTTVEVIKSVLNNVNSDYTLDDILKYLKTKHEKKVFEYNIHTASFLAKSLNFDRSKLDAIGINKNQMATVFKTLSVSEKFRFIIGYCLKFKK